MMLRPTMADNQLFGGLLGLLSGMGGAGLSAGVGVVARRANPKHAPCSIFPGGHVVGAMGMLLMGTPMELARTRCGCCPLACWPCWASCA
jgi:hypothetical protein